MTNRDTTRVLVDVQTVHVALKALYNLKRLRLHPLAQSSLIAARLAEGHVYTDLECARLLQRLLGEAIEQLKPSTDPPDLTKSCWRWYIMLKEQFVHRRSVAIVAHELSLSNAMYFVEQERTLHQLAAVLCEWEAEAECRAATPIRPEVCDLLALIDALSASDLTEAQTKIVEKLKSRITALAYEANT